MSDEPLSPAEIAAWARDWIGFHEPFRDIGTELVGAERVDLDIRAMRQVAETFERLCIVTGGRYFATDQAGAVNLPADHIRRMVANDIAGHFAPMLRIEEKSGGYRSRIYKAELLIVWPKEEITT